MRANDAWEVRTPDELATLVGTVAEPSRRKEVAHLPPSYRAMIRASPFCVLATAGPEGLDASPRGDAPGFVTVPDAHTLLLPERRGNHRVDSLRNVLRDPRVALLFLVPGRGETLRVNGRARVLAGAAAVEPFAVDGRAPVCVLEVRVEAAYFQCARAVLRSRLWEPLPAGLLATVPTAGAMLAELTGGAVGGAAYDAELPARQRATLY
ncbi:pyridoxamine 5'-phosphate oxidase family protein [Roseisolibacter sp. H3M3-2]|uniref:pyridoxamine 5'-phosphate oxidase family protein n=1 Tax=Roseisolibacter sp. H3M3-2 TaxID=3031323 RepID=UPI0023DB364B|nr:pyridoxamine 5'-phosphate oxidase family protein [Roseisolibacter sp. H3M3-2]